MSWSFLRRALALALLTLSSSVTASSVWTVNCDALTVYRADPILSPGVASGHVHAVVGGTGFSRSTTGNSAVLSKNTTCDKYTDHSNYWVPTLYYAPGNGQLNLMRFTGAAMYYKNQTCDYDAANLGRCPPIRQARAFPPGLMIVAGNSSRRSYNASVQSQTAFGFTASGYYDVRTIPPFKGGTFQANVDFPSCWDGVNLYLNNSAHVNYPDPRLGGDTRGGMCPQTHPYAMINIGAEFYWYGQGVNTTNGSQLVFANGDTTGYGFHGDFLQGWTNSTALQQSFANCFDNSCPWRAFGNPAGTEYTKHVFSPEAAPVYEQPVGFDGPISYLPGPSNTFNCVYNCTIPAPYCCT